MTMPWDTIQTLPFHQAIYLAYEMVQWLAPHDAPRFDARFRGLLAYTRDRSLSEHARGVAADGDFLRIYTYAGGPGRSSKFLPLILDALFFEFLKLHEFDNTLEMRERFCDEELDAFVARYFPDLDLKRAGMDRLRGLCRNLKRERLAVSEARERPEQDGGPDAGRGMFPESHSAEFRGMLDEAAAAAWSEAPILLSGETGTGKEMLAAFIHARSPRGQGPFLPINCGALPDNLLESELFGHRKGAFSGAVRDKPGLVLQARAGTLFLDEIAEMTTRMQVKLLRFLQDRRVRPLGGARSEFADVRIVAATNQDLADARARGDFRSDLFYRLNVFHFHIPPLRERLNDIPDLAAHFIDRFNRLYRAEVTGISKETLNMMNGHHWPGNLRELENVMHRAVVLARSGEVAAGHLPEVLRSGGAGDPPRRSGPGIRADRLGPDIERALGRVPDGGRGRRGLGWSVPLGQLTHFFSETGGRPFAPRDFADFVTPPAVARRDKLAYQILTRLARSGIVRRNDRQGRAARYRLAPKYTRDDGDAGPTTPGKGH